MEYLDEMKDLKEFKVGDKVTFYDASEQKSYKGHVKAVNIVGNYVDVGYINHSGTMYFGELFTLDEKLERNDNYRSLYHGHDVVITLKIEGEDMPTKAEEDLNYYMNLPYDIEITAIWVGEGGGFSARYPQFGLSLVSDGETPEEALKKLEELKLRHFTDFVAKGQRVPTTRGGYPVPHVNVIKHLEEVVQAQDKELKELKAKI